MKQREEDLAKVQFELPMYPSNSSNLILGNDSILIQRFFKNMKKIWLKQYLDLYEKDHNILILSHNDADGHASSAVFGVGSGNKNMNIHNIDGYTFDYTTILDQIKKADLIYITDLSLNQKQIDYIVDNSTGLICWIDHHPTSFEVDIKDNRMYSFLYSEIGISAAALCWVFVNIIDKIFRYDPFLKNLMSELVDSINIPYINTPSIIRLVSLYDTFHDDMDLTFIYGIENVDYDINTTCGRRFWNSCLYDFSHDLRVFTTPSEIQTDITIESILENGKVIKRYMDNKNTKFRKEQLIEVVFHIIDKTEGSKKEYDVEAAVLNINGHSMAFGPLIESKDICIRYYQRSNGTWNYSAYSSKNKKGSMNCTKFSKYFGGGGHLHASGFTSNDNIVDKWIKEQNKNGNVTIYL